MKISPVEKSKFVFRKYPYFKTKIDSYLTLLSIYNVFINSELLSSQMAVSFFVSFLWSVSSQGGTKMARVVHFAHQRLIDDRKRRTPGAT